MSAAESPSGFPEDNPKEPYSCRTQAPLELLSIPQREKVQLSMLNDLLAQAQKSPFYSNTIGSTHLKSLSELSDIPLLTRETIALHGGVDDTSMETGPREGGWIFRSTGSSGRPFFSIRTREDVDIHLSRAGRFVSNALDSKDMVFNCLFMGGGWSGGLAWHEVLSKAGVVSISLGSEMTPEDYITFWKTLQPNTIIAMPSVLKRMAQDLKGEVDLSKLDKTFFMGEPFWPDEREFVKGILGTPDTKIYGIYANTECGAVGKQVCDSTPTDVYHVIPDANIVEIVDPETLKPVKEGEQGRIVLTTFNRLHKPIIRLLTDDLGRLLPPCDCGLHTQMLEVSGRASGELVKIDRKQISLKGFVTKIVDELAKINISTLSQQVRIFRDSSGMTNVHVLLEQSSTRHATEALDEDNLIELLSESSAEMGTLDTNELRQTTKVSYELVPVGSLKKIGTAGKIPFLVDERK